MATANKTQRTPADVGAYLDAITDPERRRDCEALVALMSRVTGEPPAMWGAGIVGFGQYHYRYDSGREGDMCVTGFASRKGDISIYLVAEGTEQAALLQRLGRHKMGKACLYVRRMSEVDAGVLEQMVRQSVDEVRRLHG
jgi:Domain of unknown function (DU1801)